MRPSRVRAVGTRARLTVAEHGAPDLDALNRVVTELEETLRTVEWASALIDLNAASAASSDSERPPLQASKQAAGILANEINSELVSWRNEQEEKLDAEREAYKVEHLQVLDSRQEARLTPNVEDPVRAAVLKDLFSQVDDVLRRRVESATARLKPAAAPDADPGSPSSGAGSAALASLNELLEEVVQTLPEAASTPRSMQLALRGIATASERKRDRMRTQRARFREDTAHLDDEVVKQVEAKAEARRAALEEQRSRQMDLLEQIRRAKKDREVFHNQLEACAHQGPAQSASIRWDLLAPRQAEVYSMATHRSSTQENADDIDDNNDVAACASPMKPATADAEAEARGQLEAEIELGLRERQRAKSSDLLGTFQQVLEDDKSKLQDTMDKLDEWKKRAHLEVMEELKHSLATSTDDLTARLKRSLAPDGIQRRERESRAKAAAEMFQKQRADCFKEELAVGRARVRQVCTESGERWSSMCGRVETASQKRWEELQEVVDQEAARSEAASAKRIGEATLRLVEKCSSALPLPRCAPPTAAEMKGLNLPAQWADQSPKELLGNAERALAAMQPSAETCAALKGALCVVEDEIRAQCARLQQSQDDGQL